MACSRTNCNTQRKSPTTPAIVDEASLARAYERIGYRTRSIHGGIAFDTSAAVEAGRRVLEEVAALRVSAGD